MRKRVVFIGAGKVAWYLSHALHKYGYIISGISSRKKSSAKKLASRFGAEFTSQPEDIVKNADIIFITTPDSEIKNVAKNLCMKHVFKKKQLIIHTSGLLGAKILDCVKKYDALPLSMHPTFSFSSRSFNEDKLTGVWFVLEGGAEPIQLGKRIVRDLGGKFLVIESDKKQLYHLALVFASNFFVGIEDMATDLLKKCGIKKKDAVKLIKPLVEVTAKNICATGTLRALTGPVERGDIDTIKKHLELLSEHAQPYKKAYLELSKHILKMVEEKGEIEKKKIRVMKKILEIRK